MGFLLVVLYVLVRCAVYSVNGLAEAAGVRMEEEQRGERSLWSRHWWGVCIDLM